MDEDGSRAAPGRAGALRIVLGAALGAAAIAAGARVTVPMEPVPMTLQTLAVLAVGGVLGWRVGAAAAAAYLGLVVAGLPILSDGRAAPGAEFLELASAGYVVGFVPAAALAGLLRVEARTTNGALRLVALMLAAHGVVLALGFAWLAHLKGTAIAYEHGVRPFFLGAVVKSVVAAAIRAAFRRG